MEGSQIVSIHAKALDQNAALKAVKRKLSDLDKAKIDEQKRAVRSGFDMDFVSSKATRIFSGSSLPARLIASINIMPPS